MHPLRATVPHGSLVLAVVVGLGCDLGGAAQVASAPEATPAVEVAPHSSVEQSPAVAVADAAPAPAAFAEASSVAPSADTPQASRGTTCTSTRLPAMPAEQLCEAYAAKIGVTEPMCDRSHYTVTATDIPKSQVSGSDPGQFPVLQLMEGRATVFAYDDADADHYQLAILRDDHWTIWPFAKMDHSGSRWTSDSIQLALRAEAHGLGTSERVVIEWIVGSEVDNEFIDYKEEYFEHFVAAVRPHAETFEWLAIVPLPNKELDRRARTTVEWEAGPNQLEVQDFSSVKAVGPKGTFGYGQYPAVCPGEEAALDIEPPPVLRSTDPLPSTVSTFAEAWKPFPKLKAGVQRAKRLCRARSRLLDDVEAIDKNVAPAGLDEEVWLKAVESLQGLVDLPGVPCDERSYDEVDELVSEIDEKLAVVIGFFEAED